MDTQWLVTRGTIVVRNTMQWSHPRAHSRDSKSRGREGARLRFFLKESAHFFFTFECKPGKISTFL